MANTFGDGSPRGSVSVGPSMVSSLDQLTVTSTPPHNHNNAAVIATMIKGHMLNQMVHPCTTDGEAGCTAVEGRL